MTYTALTDKDGREILSISNNPLSYPYPVKPHTHNKLEISYVKEGAGTYAIEKKRYPISAGDVFLINNREEHKIHMSQGQTMLNLVIHFEPEFLWSFLGQEPDYRLLKVFFSQNSNFSNRLEGSLPATQLIARQILQIEQEMLDQSPYYDLKIKTIMESLLTDILREFPFFDMDSDYDKISQSDSHRMREVMHFIDLNIERPLTLQELSRIACISPAYFSTLFKRYNGVTLIQYITCKRVEHAITLIRTTEYNLTEIAIMCGFNSSTSFNKAFRRIRGFPPSHYRKNLVAE